MKTVSHRRPPIDSQIVQAPRGLSPGRYWADLAAWRSEAACLGADSSLFFRIPGREFPSREALAVCAFCTVMDECYEFGVEENRSGRGVDGIWGGKVLKARPMPGGRKPVWGCGTRQALRRHRRRGETCRLCENICFPPPGPKSAKAGRGSSAGDRRTGKRGVRRSPSPGPLGLKPPTD